MCLRPLTRGVRLREVKTYRVLVEKLPGPQFGVRLWEVSAYGRCPLAEVPQDYCNRDYNVKLK